MFGLNTQKKLDNLKLMYERNQDPYPNFDQRFIGSCNPYILDELNFNEFCQNLPLYNVNSMSKQNFLNYFSHNDSNQTMSSFSYLNNLKNPCIHSQINASNGDFSLGSKFFIHNQTNI